MSLYVLAQFAGALVAPLIGGYMYGGLNDWRPVFWFGFACCMATFIICFFFLEETNYQRTLDEMIVGETIVETGSPTTQEASSPWNEADSTEKKFPEVQEQVVEVADVSPLATETPTRMRKNAVRTSDNGVVVAVHADTERPVNQRVPLKRLMRFIKPLPNAWPIMWKSFVRPLLMLQLPSM